MNNNIDNNSNNQDNVTPYRASGNLNTAINNPTVNINDTMNVNIQSLNNPVSTPNIQNIPVSTPTESLEQNNSAPRTTQVVEPTLNPTSNVNKTYVASNNKQKKAKTSINLGSEFKIALLIVVILLVFIFIMPMITDLFKSY